MAEHEELLAFHRKRKSVVRASLTKLETKLVELEANTGSPILLVTASALVEKLKTLRLEYRNNQLLIIDNTESEAALGKEQQTLSNHDDQTSSLHIRFQPLIILATPTLESNAVKVASKQITLLQKKLNDISASLDDIDSSHKDSTCELEKYRYQLVELKAELNKLKDSLLTTGATPDDPVMQELTSTDKMLFGFILTVKKRLHSAVTPVVDIHSDTTTTKLPKLESLTFYGDILLLKNFWEKFWVSVYDRSSIPKKEKLMYLQNTIKDKRAKNRIAGLTKFSDYYDEVVKCLQKRYDRSQQIHQTHVHCIIEAPSLKDGSGKEIYALYDLVVQHL